MRHFFHWELIVYAAVRTLRFSSPAAGGAEVSDGGGAPPGQHVEPGGAGELPVAAVHAAPSAQPFFGPPEKILYY